ncbi:uncharacterized protein N7487_010888 [Penicillium crustosum]|uniref:uncharacterized protein n=1 Tax=Penicillium crustosum TaxID=36656 RepID=UPI002391C76B|nr:uncharacterized protein N7487_010888 [Penicillium crustosum]KAJ5393247.1 hypothetical protein N7487_010888 [Penicillium crustosum]
MVLSSRALYDRGPRLLRDIWALTGIAIFTVGLRVAAKLRIRKFGWDDILMVSALCLTIVGSALITVGVKYGFGRHVWDLDTDTVVPKVIMFDYLTQTFGIAGGTFGRISFIVFVIELLGTRRSHRVILWIILVLQILTNVLLIIILFVQCPGHGSAIWTKDGGKCWDVRVQAYYGYYQGAFNSATDLYLAVFSTYIFWNLNLKLRVKLGLVTLLGLGIFAMAASVIKAVQTRVLAHAHNDPTVATVNYDRWIYIEAYVVIITASIPCIRSLIRTVRGGTTGTGRSTYELSSPYAGSSVPTPRNRRSAPKSMIRIPDNSSVDDILERNNNNEVEGVHEGAESKKSVHVYV